MTAKFLRSAYFVIVACFVAGCSSLAPLLTPPTPVPSPQSTPTPQATPTIPPPLVEESPRILRVWLPPAFDPNAETTAAALLNQRLQQFEDQHPGLRVEVRVKSEEGILRTLSVTSNAAPQAMPDLIALSYSNMQTVASAGFLHPLEGVTALMQDPDWYAFSRELGQLKDVEYGIPFACDILTSIYRPAVFEKTPSSWGQFFTSGSAMAFPLADPQAYVSLSLYLSYGGRLLNEQGAIDLDESVLVRLFASYEQAIDSGVIPPQVRELQTDAQSLQFYRDGLADLAIVWISSDLQTRSGEYRPLLGLNNLPYSLGNGWVWALAGSRAENQPLAAELAAYLVESGFMSEWTRSAGLLPTRPQALEGWDDEPLTASLGEVLKSAHPLPPQDVVSVVGPLLQEALVRIFNGEPPEVVARSVAESLR